MKILFIGDAVSKDMERENPVVSAAANNFQLGFLQALNKYGELSVLSEISRASWPGSSVLYEKHFYGELCENLKFESIPYINVRLFKEISTMFSVHKAIRKHFRDPKDEECYVISYNGNGPFSIPILSLRKKFNYKYVCLVVDPPLYQGTTKRTGFFYKTLYGALARSFEKAARECDKCVVLNAYYAEQYLHRKDYFVLDCGVTPQSKLDKIISVPENQKYWEKASKKKHIVFTGTLHEHSGILRFIKMFQEIDSSFFDLHIWGKGIYEDDIKKTISNSESVFYHGFLPNDEIREIQRHADFLLCPNTIEHPINKVAFPSKIQEYMMSGIPVIATKVNGLGEDYYEHLYIYDDSLEDLKRIFNEIENSNESDWKTKGASAREFIIQEKNWEQQVSKLVDYLKNDHL